VNAGSTGACRSSRLVKEEMEKHDAALAAIEANAARVCRARPFRPLAFR
jgi:hypothetical protein